MLKNNFLVHSSPYGMEASELQIQNSQIVKIILLFTRYSWIGVAFQAMKSPCL